MLYLDPAGSHDTAHKGPTSPAPSRQLSAQFLSASGPMVRMLPRSLRATRHVLGAVDDFLEDHGITGKTAFATRLVVEELFANLVRHNRGGGDTIEMRIELQDGRLTLVLRDFDVDPAERIPSFPPDVERPLGERTAGGLGLHFVRSFFDTLSYEYSDRTMSVRATRYLGRTDV